MLTFSCSTKIIDYVKSHLQKEPVEIIACCYPICIAKGLVLNNVVHFKNHVQLVYSITL
jgi:hypothetical protein